MKRGLTAADVEHLDTLRALFGEVLNSRAKFELLDFWAWHDSSWSSLGAIAPRSCLSGSVLKKALLELTRAGIVKVADGTGMPFYALNEDHPSYTAIMELGRLTPQRRRYLMSHLAKKASAATPANETVPHAAGAQA